MLYRGRRPKKGDREVFEGGRRDGRRYIASALRVYGRCCVYLQVHLAGFGDEVGR